MKTKLFLLLLFAFSANTFALDTPTEDFIDNGDGTVLHKKTGLTWQRCSVGQTWTGSSCSGTASTMNWNDAVATYENKTDCNQWRLPRIDELYTITEHGTYSPAINSTIFPNTPNSYFWSASFLALDSNGAWIVDFSFGAKLPISKHNNSSVHLVSGGRSCSFDTFTPSSDFADNNNGTVTHIKTGLMWQRCSVGQTWTGSSCSGSTSTMSYASAISQTSQLADYNDWRLPTLNELNTIVEYKNSNPAINGTLFPNTPVVRFWSASVVLDDAWIVNFDSGYDDYNFKSYKYAVRLVRTVLASDPVPIVIPITIDLSSTITSSTNHIAQNNNLTYTATAQNNGTGTANNVFLKFYMPPRWTNYVSLPSDCSFNGTTTVCNVGSLAAGSSVSRSITVSFSKFRGATSVGAFAGSNETDTNKSNNMSRMITTVTK